MALHSGFVKVGGLTLHHTFGGRGSPILFIHGLGSSGYIEWRFNLPQLSRQHRVFAPDLPGYGRSDKPKAARYGIPYFARVVDRYMEERGLRKAVIVGTSMGGRIALEIALAHPGRLAALVLVNSLGLGRPKIQPYYPMMLMPRVGETLLHGLKHALRLTPPPMIRRFAARYIGAGDELERTMSDEYLGHMREMFAAEGYPAAYLATVRSIASPRSFFGDMDISKRLSQIKVPMLLIWGASDPLFPLEHATRAHNAVPGSRLVVIQGAGHTPQAERPEEFNQQLESFLRP